MESQLLIRQCPDPLMWYAGKIGKLVPLIRIDTDFYISREPNGYSNIVKKEDAEIVIYYSKIDSI